MANSYIFGTRSEATRRLQAALADRGFYADTVDGIFGRNTRGAVAAARAAFGMADEGVDAALLARLGLASTSNPLRDLVLRQVLSFLASQLKGRLSMNFLSGYRTYIVAAAMLLTGLAGLVGVDIPSFTGQAPGNLVMEALAFFFLRQGLKTGA
jgi:hypothetical protein